MSIIPELNAFAEVISCRGSLVGIDHGRRSIGIAVSDHEQRLASPLSTIVEKKFRTTAVKLLDICADRAAVGIVLGLPLNMDGTQGKQCQSVRAFAYHLSQMTPLPISFQDERLSSAEAIEIVGSTVARSRAKRDSLIHRVAASVMLQWALDEIHKFRGDNADPFNMT
ncbi:MAG: Holliday junction resolvase RuvX [Rhodobacteraceae bacterium]|nr:Holliday junction resolvase RuvX [Paracoccaceae bacterium]MCY4195354.1 Holliday junction resolvase RuvX [Paracoccaceae bacterium]